MDEKLSEFRLFLVTQLQRTAHAPRRSVLISVLAEFDERFGA